jgi:hypothetical protein
MWGHDKPGAYELLEELWNIDPELKAISLEQLLEGYDVWPDKEVFFNAFALFLTPQPTEKLRRVYDYLFLHLPSDTFSRIAPLLIPYLEACASQFDKVKRIKNGVFAISLTDSCHPNLPFFFCF